MVPEAVVVRARIWLCVFGHSFGLMRRNMDQSATSLSAIKEPLTQRPSLGHMTQV